MEGFMTLLPYLSTYGYVAIYVIVFVGGTYLPFPGGLFIIAIGALARAGYFTIYLAFLVSVTAGVTSDLLPFFLARRFEKNKFFRNYVEKHTYTKKIQQHMQRYPKTTIFISRFVGFLSMPVNILAGLSKVPMRTFFTMDLLATIISMFVYIGIGYLFGMEAAKSQNLITDISILAGVVVIVYVALFVIGRLLYKRMDTDK